jgi:hypothetical protein
LIDSGLSYAILPGRDVKTIVDLLQEKEGITCNMGEEKGALSFPECTGCDTNKLPSLNITLADKQFSLPGETLLNNDCKLMLAPSDMDTSGVTS